jgi:spore germination protein GerM
MKMKRLVYSIIISMSFILLLGCEKTATNLKTGQEKISQAAPSVSQEKPKDTKENIPSHSIKDYYPFNENYKYEYEGKGNEYVPYTAWVDYIKNNRLQLRKNNGGTESANVIEYKDGELKLIFSKEEAYYREDFTSKPSNRNETLLKEPLIEGTTWLLPDGRKRYISNLAAEISVPAGNFKALEVITEGKGYKEFDYYSLNIGLIKSLYSAEGMEVTTSLKTAKANSPLTQNIKFYYPNINNDKIYFVERQLTFKTNDITRLALEKHLKEVPHSTVGRLLGPNVKINSLYLNNEVVYVDFSKELVTEMNAGSGYEAMILQSLANTFGDYYKVSKVYITIENNPYESGHVIMKKGETFTVNLKDTVKLNK